MKKVLILLIFSFLTCFVTFAQNSSTVTLTAEQYNSLPSNVKERIEKEKRNSQKMMSNQLSY